MKYENDSEGDATYYTSEFSTTVNQTDTNLDGSTTTNFTLKAKSSWTNANLVAICPVSQWDAVFASQVDSVITNPKVQSTPDEAFSVPS